MLRLEGYWFPLRSVCIFGRPVCRDGLCSVTHWWRLLLERRPQALRGLQGIALPPPLCGKGQRVEGTSMLKQICRCSSPSSLHALTLEAAAPLELGRGRWCEYVKQRQCEFPCTYLLLVLCFPSNHNQPFCTWKSACVKQRVLLYVLVDGQGIFTKHSCDLASLLLCDWLSFQ